MNHDLVFVLAAFALGVLFPTLRRRAAGFVANCACDGRTRACPRSVGQALLGEAIALVVVVAGLFFLAQHFTGPAGMVIGAFLAGGALGSLQR